MQIHKHKLSFAHAFNGVWVALTTQVNIRIHFLVGSMVIFLSVYLRISIEQLIALVMAISMVILAEMVNTSLEFMSDAVTLEHDENIKMAKDVAAGSVFITSVFAAVIGMIVFLPKLL
jgi:diacylglycerol kinase